MLLWFCPWRQVVETAAVLWTQKGHQQNAFPQGPRAMTTAGNIGGFFPHSLPSSSLPHAIPVASPFSLMGSSLPLDEFGAAGAAWLDKVSLLVAEAA